MSRCDEVRPLLSDLAAGEAVHESVDAHLADCGPCRGHAEELLLQDRILAEMGFESRLDAILGRVRESLRTARQVRLTADGRLRRAWLPWTVAAAALLAFATLLLLRSEPAPTVVHALKPPPAPVAPPREVPLPEPPRDLPAPPPDPLPPAPKPQESKVVQAPKPAPPSETPVAPPDRKPVGVQAREIVTPTAPPPPIDFRPKSVDEAVRLGTAFLREKSRGLGGPAAAGARDSRPDELVLWTMIHAGVSMDDPEFQRLFRSMLERKLDATYRVALQAMILEEVERVKYQGRILQCAQFLADNQCRNGQWSYGEPSLHAEEMTLAAKKDVAAGGGAKVKTFGPPPPGAGKPKVQQKVLVKKMREGPDAGDNSNSMYAALGIRACVDAGVVFPVEFIQLASKAWRDAIIKNPAVKGAAASLDGWCYGPKGHGHRGYGSMTAGAVGSLAIYDYVRDGERSTWRKDAEVQAGIDWLARNFSVDSNPGVPEHGEGRPEFAYYYYMYALERAAVLYGTERIGAHDWYARGSDALLGRQRQDGSWNGAGGGNEVSDTCFAILFLRKATRALVDVATGGPRKK